MAYEVVKQSLTRNGFDVEKFERMCANFTAMHGNGELVKFDQTAPHRVDGSSALFT